MKLNDLNAKEHAVTALKENFEVNLNVKGLNKIQTQTMLNKVRGLISEAKEAKTFGAEYPSYMKLVFMEQALKEHYKIVPNMPRTKVITENEEVNRSQVILAAQDMVDSVQKMLEEISDMMVKEMPALIDSVQTEIGVNEAQAFDQTAGQALAELNQCLVSVKGQLDQALAGITGGDVVDAFDGDVDMGMGDGEVAVDGMDVSDPVVDIEGDMGTDVVADIEDVNVDVSTGPVGRARR
jgi:ribosomal protein L7/L12